MRSEGLKSRWRWRRGLRYVYCRFVRMQGSPEAIARGLAAGIFSGLFPLFGIQTILGLVLATVLRGNKVMAVAGTWISNPFTYVPIYMMNLRIGLWILGSDETLTLPQDSGAWESVLLQGSVALFFGSALVGLVGGSSSYFLGLYLVRQLRQRQRARRLRRHSAYAANSAADKSLGSGS